MNSKNLSGLIEERNGIYIIRQQMPYPLKENNAYLAESSDGWTVIDLGIDIPQTRELWSEAIKTAGIKFSHINKIIVTHCHPDHLGAAAWMQRVTGAPVYMSQIDMDIANTYVFLKGDKYKTYEKAIREAAEKNDFGEDKIRRLVVDWCDNVIPLFPEPDVIEVLNEDEEIILSGFPYHVKILPGHSDGQIVLWCRDNRTLFSGDIFTENGYLHFADWPHTNNNNPLKDFLNSVSIIEEMNPEIIYPGHGRPVTSCKEIFSRLRYRHNKLLETFANLITEPVTVGKLYENVFPVPQEGEYADYIHHHRILMGETEGYLNYLACSGRISVRTERGRVVYYPL